MIEIQEWVEEEMEEMSTDCDDNGRLEGKKEGKE
jgi:hypothetical protein